VLMMRLWKRIGPRRSTEDDNGHERNSVQASGGAAAITPPPPALGLVYGSKVKLQHVDTGRRLHSHDSHYPSGSRQQQVTGFGGDDSNDWWLVRGPHGEPDPAAGTEVADGAIIRLQHWNTKRNLHSHKIQSPVTGQQEVSAFGAGGQGDTNCNWRVVLQQGERGALRLQHVNTAGGAKSNHWLHSHRNTLPGWGHGQGEVTCFSGKDRNDLWRVQRVEIPPPPPAVKLLPPATVEALGVAAAMDAVKKEMVAPVAMEYVQATSACCLQRHWLRHSALLRHLRCINAVLESDRGLRERLTDRSYFEVIVARAIRMLQTGF
jgi:hypothetical protein